MSLPLAYATALRDLVRRGAGDEAALIENLKAMLARKGHERLYPQIVREYEKLVLSKAVEDRGVLEVVSEKDISRLKGQIEEACAALHVSPENLEVRENDRLIGGFLLRKKAIQIDASFRRKLIELYRQLVAA